MGLDLAEGRLLAATFVSPAAPWTTIVEDGTVGDEPGYEARWWPNTVGSDSRDKQVGSSNRLSRSLRAEMRIRGGC